MKSFLNTLNKILIEIGRTRTASALARAGMHKEAKALMLSK